MMSFLDRTIVMIALLVPSLATADVATFNPSKDNTLYETTDGSLSNGKGDVLVVGKTFRGFGVRRALLQFDLSSIPAGSTVNSASLTMNLSRSAGPGGGISVGAYHVMASWGEGTSVANSSAGGAGTASTAGDATWMHRSYPGTEWNSPGGDFSGSAFTSTAIGTPEGLKTFPSTSAFVAEVQAWVNNPAGNFGLMMIGDEAVEGGAQRFDSRENAIPSARPLLSVDYTPVPEPATLSLAALGAALLRRRRR